MQNVMMQKGDDGGYAAPRMPRSISELMAAHGRKGDSRMAHVTPGDVVVPHDIILKDPAILVRLKKNFEEEGQDYLTHMVGSGRENINPETGQPEFGFFSKILKSIPSILGGVAGGALFGPVGAGIGSGLGSKLSGGSNTQALLSGLGSGLGAQFLGSGSGDLAGNLTQSSIPGAAGLGESLATSLPSVGSLGFNTLTGTLSGQSLAGLAGGEPLPAAAAPTASLPLGPSNAPISRPDALNLPGDLTDVAGLDPLQQSTGIATKGMFGGGTSKQDQDYFLNLLQRRLNPGSGGYGDINEVNPVEKGYLENGLGLQFDPNTGSLLQAIANRQAQV